MAIANICFTPARELAHLIRQRSISPSEVLDAFVRQIERLNPRINAFTCLDIDRAREEAKRVEVALARGEQVGPLAGLPIGIKDLTQTAGLRTTFGSLLFAEWIPNDDAEVVRRLKAAGATVLGKTTTPEFGSHAVTKSRVFGVTRNPWNLELTPGGSSGGSAAAVASGMVPLAHGNDGGGSIRIPAAFCGIFGFKPSYGRISNFPSGDLYTALVCHGVLSRSVADGVLTLKAMVGPDHRDPYSIGWSSQIHLNLEQADVALRGRRIAWSSDLGYAEVDPEVEAVCEEAMKAFGDLGAIIEEAHPGFEDPRPYFNVLLELHVAAILWDLLGERIQTLDNPDLDTSTRMLLSEFRALPSVAFADALVRRSRLYQRLISFFERYDLLLTPTMGTLPLPADIELSPEKRIQGMYFTHPFNLAQLPAANVPAGWAENGLPVGLQIVGGPGEDALVLLASAAFETVRPWIHRIPPICQL